jgi:hypothetical protein
MDGTKHRKAGVKEKSYFWWETGEPKFRLPIDPYTFTNRGNEKMKATRNLTLLLGVVLTMVFAAAWVTPVVAEDAASTVAAADVASTITGKVTESGTLETDSGKEYKLSGQAANELMKNVGKSVEIKGTIMDKPGEMTIEVESFKLIEEPSMEEPAQ